MCVSLGPHYYLAVFLLFIAHRAECADQTDLLKIGSARRQPFQEIGIYHWEVRPGLQYPLPDYALTVCFAIVTGYIAYIIISLLTRPKLEDLVDLNNSPGFQALLADHHFRKTVISSKIQDLIDIQHTKQSAIDAIEKDDIPVNLVHTPAKTNGIVHNL